jgi:hypothetical protein
MSDDRGSEDERGSGFSSWRVAELLFGGGVIVWALSSSITAVWWAATTEARIQQIKDDQSSVEDTVHNLDNVRLGNRITALETQVSTSNRQLDIIETKVDRLLQRRVDSGANNP